MRYSATSKTAPVRDFTLVVDPIVFKPVASNDKTIRSIEVAKGIYFYSNSNFRLEETKIEHQRIVNMMAAHIISLVEKEAQRLMKFWFDNVNMYFNRRAYGVRHTGAYRNKSRQQLGKVDTAYIANSRQHTGQLRRSITLRRVNIYGAELYARRVYAKTNNADYIDILMKGATPKRGAYVPQFDLRVKRGMWKGIPNIYWIVWQTRFQKEIKSSEARLQNQIESYVEKMKVLTPKQIRAARNNRFNKEFVKTVKEDTRNFTIEFKKSKYSQNRGLDTYNEPYDERQTWEGMKSNWVKNQPSQGMLNWMIQQAEKRRNFGRG